MKISSSTLKPSALRFVLSARKHRRVGALMALILVWGFAKLARAQREAEGA